MKPVTSATVSPTLGAPPAVDEFRIRGMSCQNCVRHVTEAIQGVAGVANVTVELETGRARVRWQPAASPHPHAVVAAVRAAGYQAEPVTSEPAGAEGRARRGGAAKSGRPEQGRGRLLRGWAFNVVVGGVATAALLLGEWGLGLGMERWFQWVAFGLALPVQVFCGARFYRGAWRQLQSGRSNMDTLVALGSTTAFGYSAWGLVAGWPAHLYFMEAAAIITLISAGHWLEGLASARAESSLKALLTLAPPTARRLDASGAEREVAVAELRAGDRVVLKPGDRVPVDGEVVEGASAVDESMLTGESVPVDKGVGAKLYAGTVNVNGRLILRVSATGEATALAHIIAVVQRAQHSRAAIQKLGDQVSSVFVPAVVLVAVGTGLWWGLAPAHATAVSDWLARFLWSRTIPDTALAAAVIHMASVFIVACPCAMGLATPAAIMAGTNAAARRGILIRDGVALEKTGRLTAVVFDKTGTLTEGRLAVAAVADLRTEPTASARAPGRAGRQAPNAEAAAGRLPDTRSIAELAGLLAAPSNHPLSRAVAAFATRPTERAEQPEAASGTGAGQSVAGGRSSAAQEEVSAAAAPALAHTAGGPAGDVPQLSALDPFGFRTGTPREVPSLVGWQELRGRGVQARWADGQQAAPTLLRLGSLRWLSECRVDLSAAESFVSRWSEEGATLLGLAIGERLIGVLALRDSLKAHAAGVVAALGRQGKRVFLITGDHARTAQAIARGAGIAAANVFAEVPPERKAEIVAQLQQRGERVAFVGDGINDAPALEQADLGIAVSRASDVAREAADIILLRSDIEAVPEALALAQATLRTIKQNLFWAFFYNAAAVPLAALGFLSPVLCAAAMGASDLAVIGNALRLLRWRAASATAQGMS
jgi:Cu+-exporting ATPase